MKFIQHPGFMFILCCVKRSSFFFFSFVHKIWWMVSNVNACLHQISKNKTAHLLFMILLFAQPANYLWAAQKAPTRLFQLKYDIGREIKRQKLSGVKIIPKKMNLFCTVSISFQPKFTNETKVIFANACSSQLNCEHFIAIWRNRSLFFSANTDLWK